MSEKLTILIVDDSPENIDVLKALLECEYNIKAAPGGDVALKILRSGSPPDLLLLDVIMPGMDGFQVYEEVKGEPSTARIPVIFVTGTGSHEKKFESLKGEFWQLSKPVIPDKLMETVRQALGA